MDYVLSKLAWRTGMSVGGLALFWGWELLRPFKPPQDPRLRRWTRNLFLTVFNAYILEVLLSGTIIAYLAWIGDKKVGILQALGVSGLPNILLTVVFLDFSTYLWHMAYHEVPLMWRLHRVHHSDRDLDVTSASRFHIGEILLSTLYRLGVVALWGPSVQAVAVFEVSLLAFSQMEHANIRLGEWDRRLRLVFVTPDMHRVHHDRPRENTNSNYSTIFSWWDRLFGTYRVEGIDQAGIVIGVPEYPEAKDVTLGKLLAMPFFKAVLAACLLALPAAARAQAAAAAPKQDMLRSFDDLSIKFARDAAYTFTPFLRPTRPGLLAAGGGLGLIVAANQSDREIRRRIQTNRRELRRRFSELEDNEGFETFGRSFMTMITAAGFYGVGTVTGERERKVSLLIFETWAINEAAVRLLKASVGHSRPKTHNPEKYEVFGGGGRDSFPSGHSATAFALATTIALEYDSWAVDAACYGGATVVAYSRLQRDVHWFSDALGGAMLGMLTARTVRSLYDEDGRDWGILFDGQRVQVSRRF